jgi:hypothetical protein
LTFKERAEKQVERPASRVEWRSSFALARLWRDKLEKKWKLETEERERTLKSCFYESEGSLIIDI